jgi:hypothetical protein
VNLGNLAGSAAVAAIKEWNPRGPEAIKRRAVNKAFRKAFKKSRKGEELTPEEKLIMAEQTLTLPNGETITRTEPIIPARTSTKLAVGNGVVAAFPAVEILQWIQSVEIPIAWLESLTNSDYFMYYGSLLVSYLIARYTKSPLIKQPL